MTSLAVRLHQPTSDSERWAEQLAFRDVLGRDPALTQRYAALTQALAAEHTQDREAYPAAKTEFVRAVLRGRPTQCGPPSHSGIPL